MKRSSIFTKVLLMVLILVLALALFACNKKKDPEPEPEPEVQSNTLEKIGNIVLYADPLLKSVKSIKADSTISADLGLSVYYKTATSEDKYTLTVAGNIKGDSGSDAEITFSNTKNPKMIDLAYIGNKLYLQQPLTAINTKQGGVDWETKQKDGILFTDSASFDVSAFNPSVDSAMWILMDVISTAVAGEGFQSLNLADIGKMLKEDDTISKLNVDSLITLEDIEGGYRITTKPALFNTIKNLLGGTEVALGLTVGGIMDMVFGEETPTLVIEATLTGEGESRVVNKLVLGFVSGDNKTSGNITININKLTVSSSKAVSLTAPAYTNKALKLNAKAAVGHDKDMSVDFSAYANANFSDAYLAYAEALIKKGASDYTLKGVANKSELKFNMGQLFTAVGKSSGSASTDYYAKLHNDGAYTDIVTMANKGAAQWKADYIANKSTGNGTKQTGTQAHPEYTLMDNIYEFFGGNVAALGTNAADKKDDDTNFVYKYKDPTEAQMLTAVKNFKIGECTIGKYVEDKISIDTTSTKDNYLNTVKSILARFAAAKADGKNWIIGYNLIKDDLSAVKTWGDLFELDNWIIRVDKDGKKVLDDQAIQDAGKTNGKYTYGIFNWDTENYNGGVVLTKAGDNNDLLDAVNWFTKWDPDGNGTTDTFTAANISELANFHLAKAGRYLGDGIVFTSGEKTTIKGWAETTAYEDAQDAYDAAKKAYNKAKDAYNSNMSETTYNAMIAAETAKKNAAETRDTKHKAYEDKFKEWAGDNITTYADKVIKAVTGYDNDDAAVGTNYLQSAINDGMYLNLGSEKNKGIYGFVELRVSSDPASDLYARVEASLGFVENTVVTDATAATFDAAAINLTEREMEGAGDAAKVKFYNKAATPEVVALAGVNANGDVVYYSPADGTTVITKPEDCEAKYVNVGDAEEKTGILGELLKIWDGYCTTFAA